MPPPTFAFATPLYFFCRFFLSLRCFLPAFLISITPCYKRKTTSLALIIRVSLHLKITQTLSKQINVQISLQYLSIIDFIDTCRFTWVYNELHKIWLMLHAIQIVATAFHIIIPCSVDLHEEMWRCSINYFYLKSTFIRKAFQTQHKYWSLYLWLLKFLRVSLFETAGIIECRSK